MKRPGGPRRVNAGDDGSRTFDAAVAEMICEGVAAGRSVTAICRESGMPSRATVHRWISREPSFAAQYVAALEAHADSLVDEIVSIVDKEGLSAADKRVMMDARKWKAAKLAPRVYGVRSEGVTAVVTTATVSRDPVDQASAEAAWAEAHRPK